MKPRRDTRQRQMVLEAVQARTDHPSADRIYLDAREKDPKISRGTVYRNLNLLSDTGEIRHVKVPGVDRFDRRREPHYHLLCTECGKLSDAPLPYREALDRALSEDTGYEIAGHRTVFEGVCPRCLEKRKTAP